jgi:lipoprotein-anchoring transpeptidase ErfK/SrfK
MGKRVFIFTAFIVFLLLGGAAAVYVYDNSREDRIAKGVSVAGVDVGGMSRDAATNVLQRRLADRLGQPLLVQAGGHSFKLSARRAEVTTDVGGMVAEAVAASRSGNILSRSWRDLTGGSLHRRVALRMTYSFSAVKALVARVRSTVDRTPRDATIEPSTSGLKKVPSRTGVAVRTADLERRVKRALSNPAGSRSLVAQTKLVQPTVTTRQLARKYPVYVVVNRPSFTLSVYEHLRLTKTYRVAVGRAGLETPAGLYHIQDKQVDPSWHVPNSAWAGKLAGKVIPPGPQDPLKARWLGIYNGAGIHGTEALSSLGSAASHGCIRMAIPDVIEVYDTVPLGAPVYIA